MDREVGKLIGIIFLIAVLIFVFGAIIYLSIQHPERRLDVGADIESVDIEDNYAYITLKGGSNDKELEEIKFVFTDNYGVKRYYSTTEGIENLSTPYNKSLLSLLKESEFTGFYKYNISAQSVRLKDFSRIYKIEVVFKYKKDALDAKINPPLDMIVVNESLVPSGGGGGGTFIPYIGLIPLPRSYWKYLNAETVELNDIEYGTSLNLILENSGLMAGTNSEFIIYEKDWFGDDYLGKVNINVGSNGYASVNWIINETHVESAQNLFEGNRLELYFIVHGVESNVLKISFADTEPEPTCSDGIMNGNETGIDCGGSCEPCSVEPTCSDGIMNGNETGIDCGGSCESCETSIVTYLRIFYVSTSGDDSNDGNTTVAPWQTINKVNNEIFSPGDAILFKKGDTWRETLTVPSSGNANHYITFGAYGTGEKPRILGSENVTSWIDQGNNIWMSSNTLLHPGTSSDQSRISRLFFIELNESISWGHLNATWPVTNLEEDYDWLWYGDYIYIYSLEDPNLEYATIEVPQRENIIELNGQDYITIDGLELKFSIRGGVNDWWIDTDLHGLVIKNCEVHHLGQKDGVGYCLSIHHSEAHIHSNKIHNCGRRGISYSVYGTGYTLHNVVIENNEIYDTFHSAIDLILNTDQSSVDNYTVRNNYIHQDPSFDLIAPESYKMHGIFAADKGGGGINNVHIYNNVIVNLSNAGILIEDVQSTYVYHNTIYGINPNANPQGGGMISIIEIANHYDNQDIVVKNNLFYHTTDNAVSSGVCLRKSAHPINADINYNLYYQEISNNNIVNGNDAGGSYGYNMAEWEIYKYDMSFDVNSPNPADPLFVSTSDFHLQSNSPAIDRGVIIPGINDDFLGDAPDIGAFESPFSSTIINPKVLLSEDQDFVVPNDAINGEYVGYVKSYPVYEEIGDTPTFTLKSNSDDIYYVSSNGLITISDNSLLETGIDEIVITISKTGYTDTDITVIIDVLSDSSCVFIDPSNSINGIGTREDPLNTVPSIESNKNYLLKRGTDLALTDQIHFSGKSNVIMASYDIGNRPRISRDYYYGFLIVRNGASNITIRDLEGTSNEPQRSNPTANYDNWLRDFVYEDQTQGVFRLINCEIHHVFRAFASTNPEGTTGSDKVEVKWNYIHDTSNDGLYLVSWPGSTTGIYYVDNNKIIDVNLAWSYSQEESVSSGDGIQMNSVNTFYARHNYIDRSLTGNKFNIIVVYSPIGNVDGTEWVEISNNYLIGNAANGAIIYGDYLRGVIINNTLISSVPQLLPGIYAHYSSLESSAHKNLFINCSNAIQGLQGDIYNNVFYGNQKAYMHVTNPVSAFKNNLVYFTEEGQLAYRSSYAIDADYNIYNLEQTGMFDGAYSTLASVQALGKDINSFIADPLFVDAANGDYRLQATSPAIDAGVNLGFDFSGLAPDIGAFEYQE